MEGKTLNHWTLGKQLGAGVCREVYEAFPKAPTHESPLSGYVIKLSSVPPNQSTKANKEKLKLANTLRRKLYIRYCISARDLPLYH